MAHYTELKVYRTAYLLLFDVVNASKNFHRDLRYTVGTELTSFSVQVIINVWQANRATDKEPMINAAIEHIEKVRLYVRLLFDLRQLNVELFTQLNIHIESISKQLHGWLKSNISNCSGHDAAYNKK